MTNYFIIFNGFWVKTSEAKAKTLIAKGRKTIKLYNDNLDFDGLGILPAGKNDISEIS